MASVEAAKYQRPLIILRLKQCFSFLCTQKFILFFTLISTVYGFWLVFTMDEYLPWRVRFVKGVFWTTVGHAGLWLVLLRIRNWIRFFVSAVLLLTTCPGLFGLWGAEFSVIPAFMTLPWSLWLAARTFKGQYGS